MVFCALQRWVKRKPNVLLGSPFNLRLIHDLPLSHFSCSDPKRSLSDFIGEESQKFLRSNIAHLLALTVDSIIGLNGGLKQLLALSTNLKLSSKVQLH